MKKRSVKLSWKKIVQEPPIDRLTTTSITNSNPALNKPDGIVVMQKPKLGLSVENISKSRKLGSNRKKPDNYQQDQNNVDI